MILGDRAVRPAVLAQLVSLTGTHITALALPTVAIVALHAGPWAVALLFALEYGTYGLLGPVLGVLVDRVRSPRALLIACDVLQAAVILSVPLAHLTHALALPMLFAVATVSGALGGLTDTCIQATVPLLVPRQRLVGANSALAGAQAGGQIVGPAIAGVLVTALTGAVAMVADGLSYLASAALFGRLRRVERPAADGGRPAPGGVLASLVEGVRVLRGRPVLLRMALAGAALNLGGAGIGGLYVLYAYRSLGLSPVVLGLTGAVHSVAAIGAVAAAGRVIRRLGTERTIPLLAPVAAAALLLIPAAGLAIGQPGVAGMAAPALVLVGYEAIFGSSRTVWLIAATTLQQSLTPAGSLGRVIALSRSVAVLAIPLGALAGGAAAEAFGVTAALVGLAAVALAGTSAVLVRPGAYRAPAPEPSTMAG